MILVHTLPRPPPARSHVAVARTQNGTSASLRVRAVDTDARATPSSGGCQTASLYCSQQAKRQLDISMHLLVCFLLPALARGAPLQQQQQQNSSVAAAVCPSIATQGSFNLTEWIRASWFIQEQQLNGFQQPEDLFCVAATYELEGRTVPLWDGKVVSV